MNSVLFVLVSSFVFIVVVDAQAKNGEAFTAALTECKAKISPSAEDEKIVLSLGKLTTRGSQCLAACIKKKIGVMGSDNKMNMEKTAEMLSPLKASNPDVYEKLISITKECKALEIVEADECIAIKKYTDCVIEKKEAAGVSL